MHSSDRKNRTTFAVRISTMLCFALAMTGLATGVAAHAQATSVPPVVFSNGVALTGSNSQGASATPDYKATIGRIAANQRGDVFAVFQDTSAPGYNSLVEIPAGSNTQVTIASKISNSFPPSTVTVDTHGNLWFLNLAPDGYDSGVAIIPFVNGAYKTGIDLSTTTLPTCALPANTTKVPCQYPNIVAADLYGYLQLSDLAVDAAGNLFVVDWADSIHGYDSNIVITKYDVNTGADSFVLMGISPSPAGSFAGRLALDQNDDIFYVDQSQFVYSAAGSGTFTSVPGFKNPSGVSSDASGNIYVTDSGNNRIAVLPNISGVVSPSSAYTIVSGAVLGLTPYFSVGVDGYGNITVPANNSGANIFRSDVGGVSFGSVAVGSTTAASPLNLYFTTAETIGNLVLTGGNGASPFTIATNSCPTGTAYAVGDHCTISLTYTASAAGPQSGSLEAYSTSGALLGTARLSGSGIAPLLNVDPGTVAAVGTTWTAPSAITVDAAGNNYVADQSTGDIYKNGGTTPIATGFSSPSAVVVDGAGNLFVGDSGNNRIVEVPYYGTAYGANTVVYTGLSGQTGLAIDAAGNLYVADSGNGRVLLLAAGGSLPVGSNVSYIGSSVSSTGTLNSGFTKPIAVAADGAGNVYVADSGEILKVGIASGLTTAVAQGLGAASAVAVDPGGNVYYADSQTKTITRLPNAAGNVTGTGSTILSPSVVAIPTGIAFDASGNLYAVDTTDATVAELSRTSGALSFGNVVENVSSSPLTATLTNSGTATFTLASPYDAISGSNSADFAIQGTSICADGASIVTSGSCSVVEVFTPSDIASESSSLAFTNSAASLLLSGTGVALVNSTITGATSVVYGTAGTFSVSVSPVLASSYPVNFTNTQGVSYSTTVAIGSDGTGTFTSPVTLPVGSYTVTLVGTVGSATVSVTPATLIVSVDSFTRAYGEPNPTFTCKFTGGIVNGDAISCVGSVANDVTSASPSGTYPITPTAVGAAAVNYTIAQPPTSTFGTLTITQAAVNVSLKLVAAQSIIHTILPGVPVTFNAQVSVLSTGGAVPTGTVTFENVTLSNAITDIGTVQDLSDAGTASVTTSTLATGTIYVEAVYSGDANYAPTKSIATAVTISPPTFTMAVNPLTLSIKQGQFGSVQLTITPVGTYTAPVVLSCSGLPLEASCSFSSPSTTLSGSTPQTVTVVINTIAAAKASAEMKRPVPWSGMGGGAVLAMMVGVFAGWRRRRFRSGILTFLLVAMFALLPITGCGGLNEPQFITPIGTYPSVNITGSSNTTGVVVPVTLRLSVTP